MRRSDLSRLAQDVGQDLKRGGRGGHPGKKPTRDGAGPRSPARPDRGGTAPGRTRRPGPPRGGADPAHEAVDLAAADLLSFERKGWLRTRSLVSPGDLAAARAEVSAVVARHEAEALRQRVRVLCPGVPADAVARMSREDARRALRGRDATDEVGFLQFFNPHRDPRNAALAALATGPRLASAAAALLGAPRVRLYQSCVFVKRPGFGRTNWHSDLRMAPLDTNAFVTAWVPLRAVRGGEADSGLVVAEGSHRDFALPFWRDLRGPGPDLGSRGYKVVGVAPLAAGDASWHHGWAVHAAPPQPPGSPGRAALAVSFFADGARTLDPAGDPSLRPGALHDEDRESYADWLGQVPPGGPAAHRLLPLVWPPGGAGGGA